MFNINSTQKLAHLITHLSDHTEPMLNGGFSTTQQAIIEFEVQVAHFSIKIRSRLSRPLRLQIGLPMRQGQSLDQLTDRREISAGHDRKLDIHVNLQSPQVRLPIPTRSQLLSVGQRHQLVTTIGIACLNRAQPVPSYLLLYDQSPARLLTRRRLWFAAMRQQIAQKALISQRI